MKVVRGRSRLLADLGRPLARAAVAIGNFDGVHRGHQALVARAREIAAAAGGDSTVLTFDPHPAKVLAPALAPRTLMTLDRRLELLAAAGAAVAVVEPFDAALAAMEPEAFVRDFLGRDLGARHVVIGHDFSFGRGRRGTTALLGELGRQSGIEVTAHDPVTVDGMVCSSTKVREFLLDGRIEGARLVLGRAPELSGPVVRGAGRGRTIGFSTANIACQEELLPRTGIYAARARILGAHASASAPATVDPVPPGHAAAVSIGTNPTFTTGQPEVVVEAHLLNFSGDLYGQRIRLEIEARLRDERRFESVAALVAQIELDVAEVARLLR